MAQAANKRGYMSLAETGRVLRELSDSSRAKPFLKNKRIQVIVGIGRSEYRSLSFAETASVAVGHASGMADMFAQYYGLTDNEVRLIEFRVF